MAFNAKWMKQLKPMRNIRQHQHNNAKLPLVSRFRNNTQLTAIHSIAVDSRSEPDRRTQQKIRGGFYYYIDQKTSFLDCLQKVGPLSLIGNLDMVEIRLLGHAWI
jgi:hypothetical protein